MGIIVLRRILVVFVLILLVFRIFDFDLSIGINQKINAIITVILFSVILFLQNKFKNKE